MIAELFAGARRVLSGLVGTDEAYLSVAQAQGPMEYATHQGSVFMASQQAAAAFGTALTATAVTLTLYNPKGSGKRLIVLSIGAAVVTATTAGFLVAAINAPGIAEPTGVTPLASGIQNAKVGAGSGVGLVYSAATLIATPVARRLVGGILSTTPGGVNLIRDNVNGAIELLEGAALTIQGVTTNATGLIDLLWEEKDL